MKPPGKDARARHAAQAERAREKAARIRAAYGPDPGELEPCAFCGGGHLPSFCADPAEHPEGSDYAGFPKGAIDATNSLA